MLPEEKQKKVFRQAKGATHHTLEAFDLGGAPHPQPGHGSGWQALGKQMAQLWPWCSIGDPKWWPSEFVDSFMSITLEVRGEIEWPAVQTL